MEHGLVCTDLFCLLCGAECEGTKWKQKDQPGFNSRSPQERWWYLGHSARLEHDHMLDLEGRVELDLVSRKKERQGYGDLA